MASLDLTNHKPLTNAQAAYWLGGKIPNASRNLSDDFEYAHENVYANPEAFAALAPAYMTLVERFAR